MSGDAPAYTFNTLYYEATRACNMSCRVCMTGCDDEALVRRSVREQLTTEEIERCVLASGKEIGLQTITWSGGEFLLREDAVELVRLANEYGYASTVCTNGLSVGDDVLDALDKASGGSIVLAAGINSIDNENAWTRDGDNTLALDLLRRCQQRGIRRHVVVNVGKHNLETLDRTLEWLEDNGIPYNRSPFTPRNSGRTHWDALHFTRDDMERVIHPALRKHPLGYISYTPFFLSPEVHERYSKGVANVTVPQNPSIGCWCGTWLGLSAEGELSPCGILIDDLDCGNVRGRTMREIIDQSPEFQAVLDRTQLKGKCGRCRYKFTCGGCRAMAYYHSGDLMGEDPTCFFEPVDEATVCTHEAETNKMFRRYAFMVRHADRSFVENASRKAPSSRRDGNARVSFNTRG